MKTEQQKHAEDLYFQTDLSKTEIAQIVGVSRRTMHYWVSQNQWDTIKENVKAMPIALAGNCYVILSQLQQSILSPEREGKPITLPEVNAINKLIIAIGKLRERSTLSESIEVMNHFIDFLNSTCAPLAASVKPLVSEFLRYRAAEQPVPRTPFTPGEPSAGQEEAETMPAPEDLSIPVPEAVIAPPLPHMAPVHANPSKLTTGALPPRPASPVSQPHAYAGNRAARRAAARAAA